MYDVIAAHGDEDDNGYPTGQPGFCLVDGDALPAWNVRTAHELDEATSGQPESHQELLAEALQEALDAHRAGVIAGPDVDEIALRRARRRAVRADMTHPRGTELDGGVA